MALSRPSRAGRCAVFRQISHHLTTFIQQTHTHRHSHSHTHTHTHTLTHSHTRRTRRQTPPLQPSLSSRSSTRESDICVHQAEQHIAKSPATMKLFSRLLKLDSVLCSDAAEPLFRCMACLLPSLWLGEVNPLSTPNPKP